MTPDLEDWVDWMEELPIISLIVSNRGRSQDGEISSALDVEFGIGKGSWKCKSGVWRKQTNGIEMQIWTHSLAPFISFTVRFDRLLQRAVVSGRCEMT